MPVPYWTRDTNGNRVLTSILEVGDVPGASTALVDQSFIAASTLSGDANANNVTLTKTQTRADSGWALAVNQWTYTGTPDHVIILGNYFVDEPQSGTRARITPQLAIFKNGVEVYRTTDYARHATGNSDNSNEAVWVDENPGTNPSYRLVSFQGGTQNDVINIDSGKVILKAVEKINVFIP